MIAVWMMKATVDKVVGVISMGHWFVAAAGSVDVARLVPAARGGVPIGIFSSHFDHMLINMPGVRMMQMTVVQIINVAAVLHRNMAAVSSMHVLVPLVDLAVAHKVGPFETVIVFARNWLHARANWCRRHPPSRSKDNAVRKP